jgi:hypothetical protein
MMNFLRLLGIVVCAILMLGFGICGAWGVIAGAVTMNVGALLITGLPGVIGLALAYGCFRLIRALAAQDKRARQERGD